MLQIGIDVRLPFYRQGGISQYTIHLVDALARLNGNHHYTLFHLRRDPVHYLPLDGTENFSRADVMTPCHHPWERWALGLEISLHRPSIDLLHSPDFIPPRLRNIKRVITVHDLTFIHFPGFLTPESRHYYRDQIEWAVEVADHISADSEHTRQDLINLLDVPPSKVTTIHLSVNKIYQQEHAPEEVRRTLEQYELPPGFVLVVGTLEPRKNVPMLLQAYQRARRVGDITAPLVMVGRKGWLYDDIFNTVYRLGLADHVRHLETVDNRQLAHFYRAAGLLATPSYYEGFGLPALEAMNSGCPVLVSNRGSLPEVVGEAGVILNPEDEREWSQQIVRILRDEGVREELIAAGRVQAATFSWETAAAKTAALYERVAG